MEPEPALPASERRSDSNNWAMGAHLSALSSLIGVPFGMVLGPLVVWLIKRRDDPFAERHAREALNFNISVTIYEIVLVVAGIVLLIVLIGIFLLIAAALVFVAWLVLTIIAAVRASRGEEYQYPLTLRFVGPPGRAPSLDA